MNCKNIFGVVGWKNSGKTTLMEKLVREIKLRNLTVSTIKHVHSSFDIDKKGKDSHRHRSAGAFEVLVSSKDRFALISQWKKNEKHSLEVMLKKLVPVDLVLVEGYKNELHPKLEVYRECSHQPPIARNDNTILAIASDFEPSIELPILDLNDTTIIADFILAELGIARSKK